MLEMKVKGRDEERREAVIGREAPLWRAIRGIFIVLLCSSWDWGLDCNAELGMDIDGEDRGRLTKHADNLHVHVQLFGHVPP